MDAAEIILQGAVGLLAGTLGGAAVWWLGSRDQFRRELRDAYADWFGAADRWLLRYELTLRKGDAMTGAIQAQARSDIERFERQYQDQLSQQQNAAADLHSSFSRITFLDDDEARASALHRIQGAMLGGMNWPADDFGPPPDAQTVYELIKQFRVRLARMRREISSQLRQTSWQRTAPRR